MKSARCAWIWRGDFSLIEGSDTNHKLEIFGVFQKCLGPCEPNLREIIRRLCYKTYEPVIQNHPLRLSGATIPLEEDTCEMPFAD